MIYKINNRNLSDIKLIRQKFQNASLSHDLNFIFQFLKPN
jgi:hypothetical protein